MIIWKIFGLLFIITIILVLPTHIKSMINMRAPKNYKNILFSDNEKVVNGLYVDRSERCLDYILEVTRWIMGIILLLLLFFNQKADITINRNNFIYISFIMIISLFSIILAGGLIGGGIVKPFWNKFATHRYYAISPKGVLYDGKIFSWELFNSYSVDDKHHYIYLWSATDPKLVAFYFTPESQEKTRNIIDIIKQYLPMNTHVDFGVAKGSNINFLLPVSISILSLAISVVVVINPIDLTPFFISTLVVLHFYISNLIYKGMIPVDKLEQAEIQ